MQYDYGGILYEGNDFYCYNDTDVLMNHFDIHDYEELQIIERKLSYAKITHLNANPFKGTFDLKYLQKIHRFIFSDVYSWAGRIRGGQFFSKGETEFCVAPMIYTYAENMFSKLRSEKWLRGLSRDVFIARMAYYMAEVNALHPFREGNGRTQRVFFEELARRAHYEINFGNTEPDKLLAADIDAYNKNYEPMITLLDQEIVK